MDLHNFNQRLNETICWCSLQELVSDPVEDANTLRRRALGRRAAELRSLAYRTFPLYERISLISRVISWPRIRRATKIKAEADTLMAAADTGSILPPLRQQLRSHALNPFAQFFAQSVADHAGIVDRVAEVRSHVMQQSGRPSDPEILGRRGGRFLLFAPEENLSDGAAEYASLGFFDVDNVPPWDTWIAMFGKYLVSWVPPQLVRLVQEGLDVNPEQCILWADDSSVSKVPIATKLGELLTKVA